MQRKLNDFSSNITILIPVYNEADWIAQTIESLKKQIFTNFKVYISDNSSTDNSVVIIKDNIQGDPRFTLFEHKENKGALENCLYLFSKCQTELFQLLGGHDILAPSFLDVHVNFLLNNPRYSLSYGDVAQINEKNEKYGAFILPSYKLVSLVKPQMLRCALALSLIPKGVMINHVFRRSLINFDVLKDRTGCDHIFIGFTANKGLWQKHKSQLYRRRYFEKRDQTYMERVAGTDTTKKRSDLDFVFYLGTSFYKYHKGYFLIKSLLSVFIIICSGTKLLYLRKFRRYVRTTLSLPGRVLRKLNLKGNNFKS